MFLILTASKDTYITDKIHQNLRCSGSNVGLASTLDLFKLYDETTMNGTGSHTELSRLLVKFNLKPLRKLAATHLDMGHSTFNCKLKLFDVYGGQTLPSNFTLRTYPLSRSFDEGTGIDLYTYQDLDAANFTTASFSSSGASVWFTTGANELGLLDSDDIDIISSGNLYDGNGVINLYKDQNFIAGTEDLAVDITNIVSATIKNRIPDEGYRISFSQPFEHDEYTYFVKRFASRHYGNKLLRPRIEVRYDDSIQDHHESMFFDTSGSLFLNNFQRGSLSNIQYVGANNRIQYITGTNCMSLELKSGSFSKTFPVDQFTRGDISHSGIYSASVFVSSRESSLIKAVNQTGSISFTTFWYSGSDSGAYGFHTGSVTINRQLRSSFAIKSKSISTKITNLKPSYSVGDVLKLRVFCFDRNFSTIRPRKIPRLSKSMIFDNMHYKLVDANTKNTISDFDTVYNSSKLSTDSSGMYFTLRTEGLPKGKSYQIIFKIYDQGSEFLVEDDGFIFRLR